jgi:hypothetical protein
MSFSSSSNHSVIQFIFHSFCVIQFIFQSFCHSVHRPIILSFSSFSNHCHSLRHTIILCHSVDFQIIMCHSVHFPIILSFSSSSNYSVIQFIFQSLCVIHFVIQSFCVIQFINQSLLSRLRQKPQIKHFMIILNVFFLDYRLQCCLQDLLSLSLLRVPKLYIISDNGNIINPAPIFTYFSFFKMCYICMYTYGPAHSSV